MSLIKHYGIKFPFNAKSIEKSYVDLNMNESESIKSQLMHIIFTPLGQRIRKPKFGSRLIQYIFNPNDNQTMDDIVTEIRDVIKRNIPNCNLTDIIIHKSDNEIGCVIEIHYNVTENGEVNEYKIIKKI